MILPEVAALLRFLKLSPNQKSLFNRSGKMLGTKKGRGLDFKDVRLYVYGDDTRFIDWNVTSRFGETYVREFYDEKERQATIFLDLSASMGFGSGPSARFKKNSISAFQSKAKPINSGSRFEQKPASDKISTAFQLLGLISLLYLQEQSRVRIVAYSDQIDFSTSLIKSRAELFPVLRKVQDLPLKKSSNPYLPFRMMKEDYAKRSDVFVISDFDGIDHLREYRSLLKLHDWVGICIRDRWETGPELPTWLLGAFAVRNSESDSLSTWSETQSLAGLNVAKSFFGPHFLEIESGDLSFSPLLAYFT